MLFSAKALYSCENGRADVRSRKQVNEHRKTEVWCRGELLLLGRVGLVNALRVRVEVALVAVVRGALASLPANVATERATWMGGTRNQGRIMKKESRGHLHRQ
jgi:hypothetical protein